MRSTRRSWWSGLGLRGAWLLAAGCTVVGGIVAQSPPDAAKLEEPPAFEARVERVLGWDRVELSDGRVVRVQGWSLPDPTVRGERAEEALGQFLRKATVGKVLRFAPEQANEPGVDVTCTAMLGEPESRQTVNEAGLAAGLALLSARTPRVRALNNLRVAATRAQQAHKGWFAGSRSAGEIPFLNGAVIGLHHQDGRRYHRQVDELAEAGFRHLSLLFSVFVENSRSTEILRTQRTPPAEHLLDTIRRAKQRGMSVMLLPIVLIQNPVGDEWRGKLKPSSRQQFFLNYDRILCHYLDLAQAAGADGFSIGSELGSLENETHAWRRLIAHARGRFTGWLTYSANWDHVHVPQFLGELDIIGMTAYFELTDSDDPSPSQLEAAWFDQADQLNEVFDGLPRPVFFTELGYASQDGINRTPWNYTRNPERIDVDEQAECFRAFLSSVASMPKLQGAYFYDYYDSGGPEDHSYSPRGKPAMAEWRRWAGWGR